MPVRLTYIKDEYYELRAPTAVDDLVTLVDPDGEESRIRMIDGRVRITLNKLGKWFCVWPSETTVEIDVVAPPAEIVQGALAPGVPTSRLSSRTA
jgi:hypothetical protein